jgi:Family of unknown function (DUF6627)
MEGFMRSSRHFKIISQILIFAMLHLCWLSSYGYAEMVPTKSAIEQPSTSNTDRQRLLDLLDRQEVIDELEKYGISKVEAVARINSLTDEEVTVIAGKLDELPKGGQVNYGRFIVWWTVVPVVVALIAGYLIYLPGLLLFCPFSDDSYGECISSYSGKYWALFSSGPGHSVDNECTKKCGDQWTKCIGSKEYNEEFIEIRNQCNLDNADCLKSCEIEEEKERLKEEKISEKVEEELTPVLIEEDCDPGMESCT